MRIKFILLFIFLILLSACQTSGKSTYEIDMYNVDGDMVGTSTFIEQPEGVKIKIKVEGLDPGFHGAHIHENPFCEGPDFISAGNHYNPTGDKHGLLHPEGSHLGDLPNVEADGLGLVEVELLAPEVTLLDGKKSLLKGDGVSFILTEDVDDGMTQPSGDAGSRLICGILAQKEDKTKTPPTDPTEIEDPKEEE